jgi:hypothetical protein
MIYLGPLDIVIFFLLSLLCEGKQLDPGGKQHTLVSANGDDKCFWAVRL